MLFSIVAAPVYIPTTVYKGSRFCANSPTFVVCRPFDHSHFDRCEVVFCNFDLHFSVD